MRDSPSSLLADDDDLDATSSWLVQRGGSSRGPWRKLRALIGLGRRWGGDSRHRTSAEMTTQLTHSRGQALRDAHRTLRRHLEARPVLRQMTPHLSVLEHGLARRGSRALLKLQVPVLQRALQQLALLHRHDQPGDDTGDLRVLHERLQEAIAARAPRLRFDDSGPETLPTPAAMRGPEIDPRDGTADEGEPAVRDGARPRRSRR